ncbi:MAG: recombination mediator RecR [Marinilabiliales bacterium]
MDIHTYPSKLLEKSIEEFAKLPGIGKRTALRHVLYLLKQDDDSIIKFGETLIELKEKIKFCKICYNISDSEVCNICSNSSRDKSLICVVEDISDLLAIENTHQYSGTYHVLGGVISPMDGIGPNDLNIETLIQRVDNGGINEIIFALRTTMEGDTTNFYIYKKLKDYNLKFTTIARGVAIGNELEYTDEITLGRSIINRIDFKT